MVAAAPIVRTISPATARRLAISKQRLAGARPPATPEGILEMVRDLRCLQLDPISAVTRSHLLVLWSRLGGYDPADLDTLLWQERALFEYWAHCASIVLTEDYQLHQAEMTSYGTGSSPGASRLQAWIAENAPMRDRILAEIERTGPLLSRHFEDEAIRGWPSRGWTGGRNVSRMLDYLWISGQIMVAGRVGGQKLWDLTERCLPPCTPRDPLPEHEVVRRAVQHSLSALGVAKAAHITQHFTRGRYPGLASVLRELEHDGHVARVEIRGEDGTWAGPWYVLTSDLPLLDSIQNGDWTPRTTLLSPFDNLICDRKRTEMLWDFHYRVEIYLPRPQRRYGYYVLPILHGDRLIGRVDPLMDRAQGRLLINALHAEPDAPRDDATTRAIGTALEELATFLGVRELAYAGRMPTGWEHLARS